MSLTKITMNCPLCKKYLKARTGKYGDFMGCTGYPQCKYVFKEKVGGYPEPTPQTPPDAPQAPTTNERGIADILLLEEVQGLRKEFNDRFDALALFLKSKLG